MTITFRCPHCKATLSFDNLSANQSPCSKCRTTIPLHLTHRMREENVIDQCVICQLDKLYVQKDFNRTLGMSILITAFVISYVLWIKDWVLSSFLVLGIATGFDYLLYKIWPEVTICYRCHAQYRAVNSNPQNKECDLGLIEKYDPLDKSVAAENPAAEWKVH